MARPKRLTTRVCKNCGVNFEIAVWKVESGRRGTYCGQACNHKKGSRGKQPPLPRKKGGLLSGKCNSKKQGDVGLGIAIGYFASRGDTVCIPLTDSQKYDLIVDIEGKINRVQIKTTYHKNPYGIYVATLCVINRDKKGSSRKVVGPDDVDAYFIVTEEGTRYLVPIERFKSLKQVTLSKKWDDCIV